MDTSSLKQPHQATGIIANCVNIHICIAIGESAGAATDDADPPVVDEVLRAWPAPSGDPAIAAPANTDWVRFLPRGSARTLSSEPRTGWP